MRVEKYHYQSFDEAEAALANMHAARQAAAEEKKRVPEAMIEEIRKQYYDSGYAQGLHDGIETGRSSAMEEAARQTEIAVQTAVAAAVTSHHKQLEVTLGLITNEITTSLEHIKTEATAERNMIAELAMVIAEKIAGAAIAAMPVENIKSHVISCLKELRNTPSVVIEVSQELRDMVAAACGNFAAMAGYSGIISVVASGELAGSDCRVKWQHGRSELSQNKIMADISDVLARHGLNKESGD